MRNLKIFFFITIAIVMLARCAAVGSSTTKTMESWNGSHISKLISSWGPETKVSADGKGGKVYTWDRRWATNAFYDQNGVYQPPRERNCTKSFYVNEKGIIYSYRWQGYCP